MAVYVYSLTYTDVIGEVPMIDGGSITATTEPVSTTNITQWIEDGAGKLNAMLIARGITPAATMDETDHSALVEAVKAYGVAKTLLVLGSAGPIYDQAWERWQQVYAEYSNRPQQLGSSAVALTTTTIDAVTVDSGVATHADLGTENWSFVGMNGDSSW